MDRETDQVEGMADLEETSVSGPLLPQLFGELAMGNVAALEGIYDAMSTELYRLALWRTGAPDAAADVVQTVFVRLAERRSRLASVRDPRSYLLAMAHRAAVDRRRAAARQALPLPGPVDLLHAVSADPTRILDACRASEALREIPPAQREAVFLHHFSGMTFVAIGRLTGVPTFTAASRVRNGIRALRRLMGLS